MSKRPVQPKTNFPGRLIIGIFRLALEELAIYAIWRWLLPEFDIKLPLFVAVLAMVAWGCFAITRFILAARVLRKPEMPGLPSLVGSVGKVVSPLTPQGTVRIAGETWMATLVEGEQAEVGEEVTVTDMDGLLLHVRPGRPQSE
ncbi:MAG: NfeD family protein [Dehalococcoidia bacterium]